MRYRQLSAGRSERSLATTSGRLRFVADWVPLDKVQSIRRAQGPLQRRLGLATAHIDTAGRSVYAAFRDRDRSEADRLLDELPAACREARELTKRP